MTSSARPQGSAAPAAPPPARAPPKEANGSATKAAKDPISRLRERRAAAQLGGGAARIQAQHDKGKYTARERIDLLCDPGTFVEMDAFVRTQATTFGLDKNRYDGDGVVTGYGYVAGRLVYVYSQDFTVLGGSLGEQTAKKICKVQDMALRNGAPIIGFNDSGGARIQEGVASLAGYGDIFFRNVAASGVIPQISVIVGPSAGGAVYSPALTDFVVMVEDSSHMFVTGPDVVKTVTGEEASQEELGGASVHTVKSGVASFSGLDEDDAIRKIRHLLAYLPSNNLSELPVVPPTDDRFRMDEALDSIVPDNPNKPYDIRDVVQRVMDKGSWEEIQSKWATNVVIGIARLDGYPVGIVANQPAVLAGALDIEGSIKAAKWIRFLDAFNFPIISFVDTPGFLPGLGQEHGGIIRNGAKLLYAYCEATSPKLAVITRKSYGGAYIVMSSKHVGTDVNLAWPAAEIAVMGAEGAVNILYKRDMQKLVEQDPGKAAELTAKFQEEYREKFANPYVAAERGWVDDVIEPSETRPRLISALWPLINKREQRPAKKHGLTPL
ncbi:MAG: methylmalonyl-CoA decarboxylase subunit alpha [Thermoplasmata archaeon]|jgi:acetyl-CoA carboxylase carboxyltransferase component|nr:methylmalonyl-CoA decarboxylase subunit alpha [Thermoplasmata archaeon]